MSLENRRILRYIGNRLHTDMYETCIRDKVHLDEVSVLFGTVRYYHHHQSYSSWFGRVVKKLGV
jgi:hypothetical protein